MGRTVYLCVFSEWIFFLHFRFSESDIFPNFLRDSCEASNYCALASDDQPSDVVPFFRPSRFSFVPPTVQFSLPTVKGPLGLLAVAFISLFVVTILFSVEKPKKSVRRMLKWCYNSLIPKVFRRVLNNSHFQIVAGKFLVKIVQEIIL